MGFFLSSLFYLITSASSFRDRFQYYPPPYLRHLNGKSLVTLVLRPCLDNPCNKLSWSRKVEALATVLFTISWKSDVNTLIQTISTLKSNYPFNWHEAEVYKKIKYLPSNILTQIYKFPKWNSSELLTLPVLTTGQFFLHCWPHLLGLHRSGFTIAIRVNRSAIVSSEKTGIEKNLTGNWWTII